MKSLLNTKKLLQEVNHDQLPATPACSPTKQDHSNQLKPSSEEFSKYSSSKLINFASFDTSHSSLFSSFSCSSSSTNKKTLIQHDSFIPTGKIKYICARNSILKEYSLNKIKIISKIPRPESFKGSQWPSCSFIGFYSGHFGNSCVSFLKKNLHKCIFNDPFFPSEPKKAIFNGFLKTDSEFLTQAEETCNLSGAFAVAVLVIGKKCYVANTGKSRAFVSMKNGTKTVQLSQNHSAENEEECQRIVKNGGRVYKEFVLNEFGEKEEVGGLKVIPGKKGFTRAFGDFDCKVQNYGGIQGTIVPDPFIKSFKISEVCDFLCLTSENVLQEFEDFCIVDGLFKQLPFEPTSNPFSTRLDLLTYELIEKCRGNTSIVIIGLSQINYE